MAAIEVLNTLLVGAIEWLSVSGEGDVALVLTGTEFSPVTAVRFALVLHADTALAAAAYYHDETSGYLRLLSNRRSERVFEASLTSLTFPGLRR